MINLVMVLRKLKMLVKLHMFIHQLFLLNIEPYVVSRLIGDGLWFLKVGEFVVVEFKP